MAKDEGASRNFVMITSKTCVHIPESVFPKRESRFKMFNMQFDELHQRQSQWTVPDTELRESLRLAVAEVLLPAYRSFLKRFGPLVESGKNSQRYIKYTAEHLERLDIFVPAVLLPVNKRGLLHSPKTDLCQKVSSFELDDSLVHCVLPRFEIEDGAVQREEVHRECGQEECKVISHQSSVISHRLV
uniref:Exocyst subunit Exo70 family protein n=1 Tax=Brassica oleracea var. oleracea TaxID=109376 RepID=A0A0D3C5E4_BRAOL